MRDFLDVVICGRGGRTPANESGTIRTERLRSVGGGAINVECGTIVSGTIDSGATHRIRGGGGGGGKGRSNFAGGTRISREMLGGSGDKAAAGRWEGHGRPRCEREGGKKQGGWLRREGHTLITQPMCPYDRRRENTGVSAPNVHRQ